VFVLNRYFAMMGAAIERAGGRVDKFVGDGIMALFGLDAGPERAARTALAAARRMAEALDQLNRELEAELDKPLRMGIGLHLGHAIVGEMGYGRAVSLTAIGDTVNVASRLEALTKELGCQLIVSEQLVLHAGTGLEDFPLREVDVRGRSGHLAVRYRRRSPAARARNGEGPALVAQDLGAPRRAVAAGTPRPHQPACKVSRACPASLANFQVPSPAVPGDGRQIG
jgi:adenylate cyclase